MHKRRQDHKITFYYKMFNQLTPEFQFLNSTTSERYVISHHNLWNSNDIHTIKSNTSLNHNSFIPLNSLPN